MSYEFGPNGNYVYTYDNLQWDPSIPRSIGAILTAGPSSNIFIPSYFDSEEDALAVKWSFIDDGSVYAVQFTDKGAYDDGTGWVAYAVVEVFDNVIPTQFGSVSVQALNPNATDPYTGDLPYVNFTLQINEEGTPAYTSALHVGYQIWDPVSGTPLQAYATTITNDFYETDTRTYPTVMDGVVEMLYGRLIGGYTVNSFLGIGDMVTSFTINGIIYGTDVVNGWQYRVYRQAGPYHVILPMSAVIGPDALKLTDNDIVVWKYGGYYAPDLFPATIQPW
jgi:hypothetical protein